MQMKLSNKLTGKKLKHNNFYVFIKITILHNFLLGSRQISLNFSNRKNPIIDNGFTVV